MQINALAQTATGDEPCGATEDANALCEWIVEMTGNEFLGQASDVLIIRPARILLIVLLAMLATRLVRRGIRRFVRGLQADTMRQRVSTFRDRAPRVLVATGAQPSLRTAQRAEAIGALLRSTATVVIWAIAAVMILEQLQVSVGPLLAGAGVLGVALGFGAQHLVRDLLSGVFMLLEDQYGVGDVIDLGPATGTVEGISLRSTRIRDVEGTVWHVPNGTVDRVGNKSQQWSRALLDVEVAYATDVATARQVIKQVADEVWQHPDWAAKVLEEPEVWGVETLGASGVAIRLVVKTAPLAQWEVARELRARIKAAFDECGIEIPFPQRTVWLRESATAESESS